MVIFLAEISAHHSVILRQLLLRLQFFNGEQVSLILRNLLSKLEQAIVQVEVHLLGLIFVQNLRVILTLLQYKVRLLVGMVPFRESIRSVTASVAVFVRLLPDWVIGLFPFRVFGLKLIFVFISPPMALSFEVSRSWAHPHIICVKGKRTPIAARTEGRTASVTRLRPYVIPRHN